VPIDGGASERTSNTLDLTAPDAELLAAEEAAHDAARTATGWHDFGDPSYYRQGLRAQIRALRDDGELEGDRLRDAVALPSGPMVTALIGRLYSNRGFRRHPEYRHTDVRPPLLVVGMPRSGTTALHQALAQDSRFQGTESWLAHRPMVRPPREQWERYPEYLAARRWADADRERLRRLHWVAADEMDETNVILRQAFSGNFSLRGPLPSYDRFFFERDVTPGYQYVRDVVALIGLSSPDKPWLLKNPGDILAPEAVLTAFPEACVVCTHRDPVAGVPSLVNLLLALRTGTQRYGDDPGAIDRSAMARREFSYWKIALDRYEVAKRKHPERFYDVWHRDLVRDPVAVIRAIYARFNLDLSAQAAESVQRWAAEATQDRRDAGARSYAPEDFGLTAEEIREHYADYRAAYGFT
jgi:hypothetical protein